MAVPPALVRVSSQWPLAPSDASVTSIANDKGDNEMILGAAQHISLHLLYSRGKSQKTSTKRPSDEGAVRPVIPSNGVPFLQMRSVGSHTSEREKEEIKERTGEEPVSIPDIILKAHLISSILVVCGYFSMAHCNYNFLIIHFKCLCYK